MAADQKKAQDQQAHIALIDETGCLLAPLVRRSQARRGRTPILPQQAAHRQKVSAIAALTISPHQHHLHLYFQTYPDNYINNYRASDFVRQLLRHLRGPLIGIWDGGSMHKGPPIRQLQQDYPRLSLERLPPYAPELNPVEFLWNYLKYDKLANYAPRTVLELDAAVHQYLDPLPGDPILLDRFFRQSDLPWLIEAFPT